MASVATIFVFTNAQADSNSLIDTAVMLEPCSTIIGIDNQKTAHLTDELSDALLLGVKMSEHRLLVKTPKVTSYQFSIYKHNAHFVFYPYFSTVSDMSTSTSTNNGC
jgi:hypothetical protein